MKALPNVASIPDALARSFPYDVAVGLVVRPTATTRRCSYAVMRKRRRHEWNVDRSESVMRSCPDCYPKLRPLNLDPLYRL
jgi:hypothetical protein